MTVAGWLMKTRPYFIDAYNAFAIKMNGVNELYSYDKHYYDRMNWLNRIEPVRNLIS